MMKQRILVLGSEHFVAAKVVAALASSDWATAISFTGSPAALSDDVMSGVCAIFNGAAGSPRVGAHAKALYGALQRLDVDVRVVHLSSMTVYGSMQGEALESTPLRPDIGAYGAAQINAESFAMGYPRSVILRPGCEYGPGCPDWSARIARLLRARRLGDLGAAGDGVCNSLFIDDLVAAIMAALRAPSIEGQAFNLAMRGPPTWNEYFVRFGQALGAVPVARIGARRLQIERSVWAPALKALELLERRARGMPSVSRRVVPPPLTPSLLDACRQDITLNVGKAERALGMVWTPLNEGLRKAAASLPRLVHGQHVDAPKLDRVAVRLDGDEPGL